MARQFIYHMSGLSKAYGNKKVLDNIHLSFYPDAKIGILGPNGAGKSTLLKIMAGNDTEFTGEAWAAEGATVGYLPQEPQLDADKTVFENVMEGVADKQAILDRYNELMMNYSDETAEEGAKLQDVIDAQNLWDLENQVEMAMDALRCPPGDAEIVTAVGRREPPRRDLQAAPVEARHPAPRRADQPSRRRDHPVAREAPARVRGLGADGHPRSLLPRQRHRLDPRARSRPWRALRGQLLGLSGEEGRSACSRRAARTTPACAPSTASASGSARAPRPARPSRRPASRPITSWSRRPRTASRPTARSSSRPASGWATRSSRSRT